MVILALGARMLVIEQEDCMLMLGAKGGCLLAHRPSCLAQLEGNQLDLPNCVGGVLVASMFQVEKPPSH